MFFKSSSPNHHNIVMFFKSSSQQNHDHIIITWSHHDHIIIVITFTGGGDHPGDDGWKELGLIWLCSQLSTVLCIVFCILLFIVFCIVLCNVLCISYLYCYFKDLPCTLYCILYSTEYAASLRSLCRLKWSDRGGDDEEGWERQWGQWWLFAQLDYHLYFNMQRTEKYGRVLCKDSGDDDDDEILLHWCWFPKISSIESICAKLSKMIKPREWPVI